MNTTVTITIGRNIGPKPMPAQRWAKFRQDIARCLASEDATIFVADAKSTGEWNGIAEEARTWVAEVDEETIDGWSGIRSWLADAAKFFGQDAIALTTGQTELVTPATNVDPDVCRDWTHCTDCCGPCPGCGGRPEARVR